MAMDKIDIVLTWVDAKDNNWIEQRNHYAIENDGNISIRFKDWENLQYVFRGIEKFMPWINKIFFVTWGHLPNWLNTNNPKLVIVRHEDYIPKQYLPTFNSNVLDVNMFRINGLSEQYINFNDDTFVIKPTKPTDFFKDGVPKDFACLSPQPIRDDSITNIELNNLQVLNKYFGIKDIKRNYKKWISIKQYGVYTLRTLLFLQFSTIIGIYVPHIPISHLKSTYEKLWEKEYIKYDETSSNKFRSKNDINDWLAREWQIMSGEFEPRSAKFGILLRVTEKDAIHGILNNSKYKMVCINDNLKNGDLFEEYKNYICNELDRLMPEKSSFEL